MKNIAFKAFLAGVAALPAATPAFAQDNQINGNIILTSPAREAPISVTSA